MGKKSDVIVLIYLFFFFFSIFFNQKVLADHNCYQSCGSPSYCNNNLSCIDNLCKNPDCPDQTDCTCDYPNCKNLSGPSTVVQGNTYNYSAYYEDYYGPVTKRGLAIDTPDCATNVYWQTSSGGPGTVNWSWTPTSAGTYTIDCRAWNDVIAECRGACVDGPPRYLCPGPNAKMTVTVVTPTPTPTPIPIPNCKNLSGPSTVVQGNTYNYSAYYEDYYGPVTKRGLAIDTPDCATNVYWQTSSGGPGRVIWSWTPTSAGTYTIDCRAWNDAIAECRGACVDGPPRYLCPGPNASMTVTVVTPTPTPTLYPTVAISGLLKEYKGALCSEGISSPNVSINIVPSPGGVTPICGITPPSDNTKISYGCTIVFNNQGNPKPTPAQNLTLIASAVNYQSAYWTDNNTCTDTANNTLAVNVAAPNPTTAFTKDIFFQITEPWIKLKNASYAGNNLTNIIPLNLSPYDEDDNGDRYFIINSAGNDPGLAGAETLNLGTASVSSENWKATSYNKNMAFTTSTFLEYVKSRKQYQTITALDELTENKINFYQGNLTITNQSDFNNKKVVLLVEGTVTLNTSNFQPANAAVAILASTINFSSGVQSANGIFIAETINTGSTTNQGLKIKGNLIASSFTNGRHWADNSKPSVFIVFDPNLYLNLLPYLSIDKYDWQQIQ